MVVTEKGLEIVKSHLGRFDEDPPTAAMVQRLQNTLANGGRVTGADRNFYVHELRESTLMGRGVGPEEAHLEAIGQYFYDGEGKRVKKVTGNETTIFVYSS